MRVDTLGRWRCGRIVQVWNIGETSIREKLIVIVTMNLGLLMHLLMHLLLMLLLLVVCLLLLLLLKRMLRVLLLHVVRAKHCWIWFRKGRVPIR